LNEVQVGIFRVDAYGFDRGRRFAGEADDSQSSTNQPLLLTKPTDDNNQSGVAPIFNQLDDPFQAPASLFGRNRNSSSVPLPPPTSINYRPADDKKNWMLMTPEEILGVKTPEQVLGVQSSEDSSLNSLGSEQKFMNRLAQSKTGDTKAPAGLPSLGNWTTTDPNKPDDVSTKDAQIDHDGMHNLGELLNASHNHSPFFQASRDFDVGGYGQFTPPDPAQLARQKADMNAFRSMLGEQVEKSAVVTAPVGHFNPTVQRASDYNPAEVNLYGVAVKQLNYEASKPVGLDQLSAWSSPKKKKEGNQRQQTKQSSVVRNQR